MKEGQKDIYQITCESKKAVENSPFLERLKKESYEVLFMVVAIDENAAGQLKEYDGKKLVSALKEGLKLDDGTDEEKEERKEKKQSFENLCKVIKDFLGDKVEKVVISDRTFDIHCCLVTGEYGWLANMESIMKAQALRDISMGSYISSKKTMEINADNGIMEELRKRVEADKNDKSIKNLVMLLFKTALLTSGFSLDDPHTFAAGIHRTLEMLLKYEAKLDDETIVSKRVGNEPLDAVSVDLARLKEGGYYHGVNCGKFKHVFRFQPCQRMFNNLNKGLRHFLLVDKEYFKKVGISRPLYPMLRRFTVLAKCRIML